MHGIAQGRVAQQHIDICKDRIKFWKHLLDLRNHLASLRQGTLLDLSEDGITGFHQVDGIGSENQVQFHITHQIFGDLSPCTIGETHPVVETQHSNDLIGAFVVIDDILDHTDSETIGIDGARHREACHIIKLGIVAIGRREERHALQKLQTEKHDNNACNGNKCNLNLF